ncbi:hypothetical protein EXIGUO8H_320002 [Exiguobacterium sp. 8H]|uniref:type II toxin-antitoxin system PemK/MazF family toxin n=1 Tax=unclassified Exiguobacterium TaxID=2644629 RepID=UPI0012EF8E00|nr:MULTISPECIES: type II toxin-antitoxin system PemK/MazF family toxin [unclassified Exiguobacterium]VXB82464.1 hypothetical protein EXIGUO8H_320002 [Exiguobacterium sp. 8H]VXC04647.1 hypothetical protein EXIGUO8A_730002 [Exiguobacterium sp. 8A]
MNHKLTSQLYAKFKKNTQKILSALQHFQDNKKREGYLDWMETRSKFIQKEKRFRDAVVKEWADRNHEDRKMLTNFSVGDVIHADFGFNVGSEFGGTRYAIVLHHSPQRSNTIFVTPLRSAKAGRSARPTEIDLGEITCIIQRTNTTMNSWADLLQSRPVSKVRMIGQNPVGKISTDQLNALKLKWIKLIVPEIMPDP